MPDIEKNGYGVPTQMIQGGCKLMDDVTNTWLYEFEDRNGPQIWVFHAEAGEKPEIGDTIQAGVLVKKESYRINNDPGVVQRQEYDETWPDNTKGF